jgi:hypothetical protein
MMATGTGRRWDENPCHGKAMAKVFAPTTGAGGLCLIGES